MNITYREIASQVRGIYKLESEDAFVTDYFLYSLFKKYADVLLRRKQNEGKLKFNESLYQWIDVIEMIDVDKIEADCVAIKTNCTFKRSRKKLPKIVTFDSGPLIDLVMSLDTSERLERTTVQKFREMGMSVNFKYNKSKYFWLKNEYLYTNVDWSRITMRALFEESVTPYCKAETYGCNDCEGCADTDFVCTPMQDNVSPYPSDLVADVIGMIQRDLGPRMQIPSDIQDNSQNVMR